MVLVPARHIFERQGVFVVHHDFPAFGIVVVCPAFHRVVAIPRHKPAPVGAIGLHLVRVGHRSVFAERYNLFAAENFLDRLKAADEAGVVGFTRVVIVVAAHNVHVFIARIPVESVARFVGGPHPNQVVQTFLVHENIEHELVQSNA